MLTLEPGEELMPTALPGPVYKGHLNLLNDIDRDVFELYPADELEEDIGPDCESFGVADDPTQILERFPGLITSPRNYLITCTRIPKDPDNAGKGGGWRWRKWGFYIGTGDPQHEYLDDEDGFDNGVWVFSIVLLKEDQ